MLICLLVFSGLSPAYTSSSVSPSTSLPDGIWMQLKVSEFVKLKAREMVKITGKKMNLKERIAFSVMKKSMVKAAKKNPDLTVGVFLSQYKKSEAWVWILVIAAIVIAVIIASATSFSM